jgi:hypothetical protein
MDTGRNSTVRTCSELSAGEEIEAWHKGRLFHRGRVAETIPTTDLFWIVDSRTGARKLLDVEALDIVRVEAARIQAAPIESIRTEGIRTESIRSESIRTETGRAEAGHVDKAIRADRAAPLPRPARREPHVVWFSSAG